MESTAVFKCPNCLELFNSENQALIMSCNHTFCVSCTSKFKACPGCFEHISPSSSKVNDEIMKHVLPVKPWKKQCTECGKDATSCCKDCNNHEPICVSCFQLLHQTPRRKSHKLIETITPNSMICKQHNKKLEFYCNDCKCLICYMCDKIGFHKEHASTLAEKIEKNIFSVNKLNESLQTCEKDINTKLLQLRLEKQENKLKMLKIKQIQNYKNLIEKNQDIDTIQYLSIFEEISKISQDLDISFDKEYESFEYFSWDSCTNGTMFDEKTLIATSIGAWGKSLLFSTAEKFSLQLDFSNTSYGAIGFGHNKVQFLPGRDWDEIGNLDFYYNIYAGSINGVSGFAKCRDPNFSVTLYIDNGSVTCSLNGIMQSGSWAIPEMCCLFADIYHANSTLLVS